MIVICGAGIAGLTLANALEQLGEDFLVLERSPAVRTEGAGLVLHHNALCILEALGVAETISGVSLSSFQMVTNNGRQVLPFSQRGASRALAVHREEVMQALLERLPNERIRCNSSVDILQRESPTVVQTAQENIQARVVVIANGAASDLHGAPHILPTGQWCWRTIVPCTDIESFGAEHWFGRHRLGIIPISQTHAYSFHVINDAGSSDTHIHLQWLQEQQRQGRFGNLDFSHAQWLSHPLDERRINWGYGNHVAIGDAAHSMTPNMGQGAAMAMEDAWTLAELIAQGTATDSLAHQLADKRQKRVRAVQRQSRQLGQIAHWQNKALCQVRNTVFRLTPSSLLARQQQLQMRKFTDYIKQPAYH